MAGFEGFTHDYSGLMPQEAADYFRTHNIQVFGFENISTWDFHTLQEIYDKCIYIRTIVDMKADCVKNINLRLFKVKEKAEDVEIFSHPVLDLLENPTPLQSTGDWFAQRMVYQLVHGKSFIQQVKGRTEDWINAKAIWNLPPASVRIVEYLNGANNIYERFTIDEIIDYYEFSSKAGIRPLQPSDVLSWMDFKYEFNTYQPKFKTLKDSAANLMAIQESRGQIIKHRGAVGMLSPEMGNDPTGSITAQTPDEKKNILTEIKKLYGLLRGQSPIMLPNKPMKWSPMEMDVAKLQLETQELAEFNKCCDLLGVPREIFDGKSTFDNQIEAKKKLYTDKVIPWANSDVAQLNMKFGLPKQGLELRADFSHLEVLSDDQKKLQETAKVEAEKMKILIDAGIITAQTAQAELGYEITDVKPIV